MQTVLNFERKVENKPTIELTYLESILKQTDFEVNLVSCSGSDVVFAVKSTEPNICIRTKLERKKGSVVISDLSTTIDGKTSSEYRVLGDNGFSVSDLLTKHALSDFADRLSLHKKAEQYI